jgi:hypothetical protein
LEAYRRSYIGAGNWTLGAVHRLTKAYPALAK